MTKASANTVNASANMGHRTGLSQQDVLASFVVFVVALPLSLGIAMASGAPLAAGMVSAIVGGVVTGFLTGSPLSVSGPAAGLTALVFAFIQKYGLQGLAVIGFLAGLIQILFAVAKAGRILEFLPKTTLEGVLSAIGFTIMMGQLHVLMGGSAPPSAWVALKNLPDIVETVNPALLLCGAVGLSTQLVWRRIPALNRRLPAALPAVLAATLVAVPFAMPRVELAPLVSHIRAGFGVFTSHDWENLSIYLLPALTLAIVGSAESLLTAKAVALLGASKGRSTPCHLNRELLAQGAGNSLAALLGGLPLTAVMVRSAANVDAGARSRWSSVLHGVWIAVFVVAFPVLLNQIPLAALASILVVTGAFLVNVPAWMRTWEKSRWQAAHWLLTGLAVLAMGLLEGMVVSIAVYFASKFLSRTWDDFRVKERAS